MKQLFLFIMLSLSHHIMIAEGSATQIVFRTKSGSSITYYLSEKPKISFTNSELIVNTTNVEVKYALNQILGFTYENTNDAELVGCNTDCSFQFQNDTLIFSELPPNSTICIYTTNGVPVLQKEDIQDTDMYIYPLTNLNAGVYFVKINNTSYKILKK